MADYYQHCLTQPQPDARAAIVNMARGHRISTDLAHKLLRETDLAEAAFQTAADG